MAIINGHYSPWAARHHLNDGVTDILSGTESDDVMHGYGGDDNIWGGGGHDEIYGGRGNDLIIGSRGWDTLTGGPGNDIFRFSWGDSPANFDGSDIITDFNTHEDKIDFWFAYPDATSSNYLEFAMGTSSGNNLEQDFNEMRSAAQEEINDNDILRYVFGTNGKNGYLFVDLDHDGTIDTGIELRGLDSTGDFSRFNIFNPSHPAFDDLSHMDLNHLDLRHMNLVV